MSSAVEFFVQQFYKFLFYGKELRCSGLPQDIRKLGPVSFLDINFLGIIFYYIIAGSEGVTAVATVVVALRFLGLDTSDFLRVLIVQWKELLCFRWS